MMDLAGTRRAPPGSGYPCPVYWILAAIFIVIALAAPRLRPIGVAGIAILAALLAWAVVQRMRGPEGEPLTPRRSQPTSPAAQVTATPLTQLEMADVRLSGGGAPFELRGRIVNRSDARLKSVTVRITRRDCYEGALDPSGCVVMWQDRRWLPLDIPPSQSREFAASIWMHGSAPRPRGDVQDSFELTAATGEPVAAPSVEEPDA
jgi:hypothetical protein